MKKIMLSIAGTMVICLCMALVFYQFSQESGPLTLAQPKMVPKVDQSKQNVQVQQTGSTIDYSLTTGELQITFDKGKSWTTVPIETDKLFAGEYNGNKQELIENSYLLTENRAAFLYADGPDQFDKNIVVTYSLDHGKHWQDSIVTKHYPALRFRKVDFLNQNFGYVILSGDRTVSQEMSNVYLTHDGGKTWRETNPSNETRLVKNGGFIDEKTGFLSYGFINPEEPEVFVTQDGGDSWQKAAIAIPKQYKQIFVTAELPFREDDHLAVLMNQGPNGDYAGGNVKGKFISTDNGKTWEFSTEVKPDEAE